MKESKKPNEEEIKKFFEEKLNQSGYVLQTAVENKLSKAFFDTSREVYYVDKDESKGRPIDLTSLLTIPDERILKKYPRYVSGSLRLIIECKQLPDHAWVFFPSSKLPAFSFPESITITGKQTPDPALKYFPFINHFIGIPYAGGFAEFSFHKQDGKKQRSNEKDSNLYEAVMTVTKATRHSLETTRTLTDQLMKVVPPRTKKTVTLFAIFQPIIVFKGRMYEANHEEETLKLKPIKYAQIPKNYVSKNYEEVLGQIHVVSYDSFDEYLEMLLKYYNERAQLMIPDQTELLGIVDSLRF